MTREQKIKQLRERGWSDARIKSHMFHWDGFEKRVKPAEENQIQHQQQHIQDEGEL